MEAALVGAVMGSIIPKMSELHKEKYKLQKSVSEDLMFLRRSMEMMQAAIVEVGEVPQRSWRIWVDQVRQISYEIEDSIDRFMLSIENNSAPGSRMKAFALLKKATPLHRIRAEIKNLKDRVGELAAERRQFHFLGAGDYPFAITAVDPGVDAIHDDPTKLVGVQEATEELIKRLQSDGGNNQQPLKILSIFGFPGVGKTSLAKAVYGRMRTKFDCEAFVSVGRNPEPKRVFSDILLQINREKYSGVSAAAADEKGGIQEIRELLKDKRYFIIVDDIWDTKSWEQIRWAFVDCNSGSIVITTSRIYEVAARAGGIYKLEPLSPHHSKELFRTRIFGYEDKSHDAQTILIIPNLLQKCGGVPLAIITIASFLCHKQKEDWYRLSDSINFWASDNIAVEYARRKLLSSYYDLPNHLKVCLLHLSIFPRNYMIRKDTLIWKWVAEGFIPENPRAGLFEMGEEFFNELINRNMIQPVEISHNGDIIGCRVHDMVIGIICSKAKEENFLTLLNGNEQPTSLKYNARRLALHGEVVEGQQHLADTNMSLVRSFNAIRCDIRMIPSFVSFELLRVLAIEDCSISKRVLAIEDCSSSQLEDNAYILEHISRLFFLRYLGLSRTPVSKLPEKVGKMKFLEILDVRQTGIPELPKSVSMLSRLKCLRADGGSTRVPDWIGKLTTLEELSLSDVSSCPNFVKEVGKLTMLRELKIWIHVLDERSKYALVKSLSNLQKIQVLHLNGGLWMEEAEWEGYVPPRQLRRLSLRIKSYRRPRWINSLLLPTLSHLSVDLRVVEADDLTILGRLPGLITLELFIPNSVSLDIKGSNAFPRLRHLYASGILRFPEAAAPQLESVHFNVMSDLNGTNFQCDSLDNLPSLKEVRVEIFYSVADVAVEVKEELQRAVDNHVNHPRLHVNPIL